jgi:hypothetical protein
MPDHTFKDFNPYTELGVKDGADADTVKKAYQKLAKMHHPDRGGDEEQFKRIQAAYEFLKRKNQKDEGSSGVGFNFDFDEEALAQEFVDEHDNIIFDFTGFISVLLDTFEKLDDDLDELVIAKIKKLYITTCAIQEFLQSEDIRGLILDKISRELKDIDEELSGEKFDDFIKDFEDTLAVTNDAFLSVIYLFEVLKMFNKTFGSFTFKSKFPQESESQQDTNKKYRDKYHLQRILQKHPERKQQIIDELGDDILSYFRPRDYAGLLELLDEAQRDKLLPKLDWSKVDDHRFEAVLKSLNQAQQARAIPLLNWKYVSLRFVHKFVNSLSEILLQTVFKLMLKANPGTFANSIEAGVAAEKLDAHAFKQYLHAGKESLRKNDGFPLSVLKSPGISEKNAQVYVDFFQPEITAFLRKKAIPTSDINPVALPFVVAELCESIKSLADIKGYLDYVNTLPQPQVGYINLLMERIDACNLNVDHMISLLKLDSEGLFHQCMVVYLSNKLPELTISPKYLDELKAVLTVNEFDELSQKLKTQESVIPESVQENKNTFFSPSPVSDHVPQDRIGHVLSSG